MRQEVEDDTTVDGVEDEVLAADPLRLTGLTETKSRIDDGISLSEPNPIKLEFAGPIATREELAFRHSGWRAKRLAVWRSLVRLNASSRRLERFSNCGACLHLQRRDDGQAWRLCSDKCRDRCCVPCGAEKSARIVENLVQHMEAKDMRFVTLTLRHSHTPLHEQIDRLYRCFATLRKRAWWTENVKGGAAFLEVKLSERTGLWHVHLHLLVEGDFLLQRKLSTEWLAVTGDSSIVDVRKVADFAHVSRYVVKYVTKPLDASCFADTEKLDEAVTGLKGRRLCLTWGRWRGFRLLKSEDDGHVWTSCGSALRWYQRIRDEEAGAAAEALGIVEKCPAFARWLEGLFRIGKPPDPTTVVI
jgi:Replication protein